MSFSSCSWVCSLRCCLEHSLYSASFSGGSCLGPWPVFVFVLCVRVAFLCLLASLGGARVASAIASLLPPCCVLFGAALRVGDPYTELSPVHRYQRLSFSRTARVTAEGVCAWGKNKSQRTASSNNEPPPVPEIQGRKNVINNFDDSDCSLGEQSE